jgi:sec-independent protein translocase protein TatC
MKIEKSLMTAKQHFAEFRKRIIFSLFFFISFFLLSYFFSQKIYNFLLQPFIDISQNNLNRKIIYTSPAEAFITYLKLSFYSAIFFSMPIFITQIYLFLSPALYKNEKKNIFFLFFSSPFLFFCGAIFAFFLVLPQTLEFFASFEYHSVAAQSSFTIQLETKISEYLNFVANLLFGFGIAFQLPILLLFLIKYDCLSTNDLRSKRKYWIVMIFILSAILTPPDVLSQISLAILLILFFEIVILIGNNFNKKK